MRGHDYKTEGGHLSSCGSTFLNIKGKMPMCSPDLTFKCLSVSF